MYLLYSYLCFSYTLRLYFSHTYINIYIYISLPFYILFSHSHSFYLHSAISTSTLSVSFHLALSFRLFPSCIPPSLSLHFVGTCSVPLALVYSSYLSVLRTTVCLRTHTRARRALPASYTHARTRAPHEGYKYKSIRVASTRARARSSNVSVSYSAADLMGSHCE